MRVLPDTSIWVEYLRRGNKGSARSLDGLLASGDVVMCGPVAAELLAGAARGVREDLWGSLHALPWFPFGPLEWRRTGHLAGALRDRGLQVPLTDLEIAVSAVSAGCLLWTNDSDFERVADVLPELQRYRAEQ